MDANSIQYFVAVAKYGSINQAAKAMFISQPQLSHIIRSIEDDAGMTLIQRTRQGSTLTPEGEQYLKHCEIILNEMENLRDFINKAQIDSTQLSVCMTRFSHTSECFNEVCRRHQNMPRMHFTLKEDSTTNVILSICDGTADIGVLNFSAQNEKMMLENFESKNLSYLPLASFRPYVSLSSAHPLLEGGDVKEIDIADLMDYGFVRYHGQYEDFIYHIAMQEGAVNLNESEKVVYVTDRQEQMHLISVTNFYTIGISEFTYQDSAYGVVAIPLKNTSAHLQFGIITRKNTTLSSLEQEFADEVKKMYQSLQEKEKES
ncbi:MAG: LysR family transcriptional regulator [Lachnospiraceae bacterium]|nr:LysR family transcriptional regulator [Lachnospiraceae bacterium]MBP3737240.1 LysR family transcriptional regulator [Lachnospiraceae bacterium]